MRWPGNCATKKKRRLREFEALAEAMSDDFTRELGLLVEELENLKAALLQYAERERAEVLAGIIASLPSEKQLVLALRYQEKLTAGETAVVLGVPEGSIYRTERDALKGVEQTAGRILREKEV